MTLRFLALLSSAFVLTLSSYGQGLDDALRFSQSSLHGSARFNAMGGAFTALGGELGAIHLNPASVSVFTKNEIGFTLGIGHTSINTEYYSDTKNAQYGKPNINNMGIVFSSELENPDWTNLNIGITFSRTNDFNRRIKYSAEQDEHSYAQFLVDWANHSRPPNYNSPGTVDDLYYDFPFDAYPAYSSYIINNFVNADGDDEYYSPIDWGEKVKQEFSLEESGRSSEMMLSIGSSYRDKLYLGFGLKVGTFALTRKVDHMETPEIQDEILRHSFQSELETRGTSYSLSGGIIARISDMFRVGISAQTPHFYVHNEYFRTIHNAQLTGAYLSNADTTGGAGASASPEGNFRYNFHTPWVFNTGVAAVFGPRSILSVDYEFRNYSSGKFKRNSRSSSSENFEFQNEDIKNVLGITHNFRAGFEYRLLPLSLRAGYNYSMDPVKRSYRGSFDRGSHQISLGAGMRFERIFLDVSYYYHMTESPYAFYDTGYLVGQSKFAAMDIVRHGIAFSIGIRY